ncbi:MAG: DUF904 domain-containing protein [Burkholderiales bacterium]
MVPSQHPELDRVCDQIEQLLDRHEQMHHIHTSLHARLAALVVERDQLQQRIEAACSRIDALIVRLPVSQPPIPTPLSSMPR